MTRRPEWSVSTQAPVVDTRRFSVLCDGAPLSWSEVYRLWLRDESFRDFFIELLKDNPFRAYYWETPPLTQQSANRPFEFVLIDSPVLAGAPPEREAYTEYFERAENGVAQFANLGGDAWLVVPTPQTALSAYPHLAAFSREAPRAQQHAFWQSVGGAIERRLGDKPMWVSTAGTGVYWLHLRLDSRPKYYNHRPYRDGELE